MYVVAHSVVVGFAVVVPAVAAALAAAAGAAAVCCFRDRRLHQGFSSLSIHA